MIKLHLNNGFTLLELLIATAILLTVLSGLMLTFVSCILLNESNSNLIKAVNDAQYILEQVKGLAYNQIATYTSPVFNNLNNESITLSRSIGSRIAEIVVTVNWVERQRLRSFVLATRIAK